MNPADIKTLGDQLYDALRQRRPIPPPRQSFPAMTTKDAYTVSMHFLERRKADGEVLVGHKIGLTSRAVQEQLGVREPDFGNLTDAMRYPNRSEVPVSSTLISPKIEGEIAFVLAKPLSGPGVTPEQVLDATDYICPCFEIVDSRVRDWDIRIADTVCDNASSGLFVLGDGRADPRTLDLESVTLEVRSGSELLAEGVGAAALGSPLNAVAWLANALATQGIELGVGEIVLSGSLVPFLPAEPGRELSVVMPDIGEASIHLV